MNIYYALCTFFRPAWLPDGYVLLCIEFQNTMLDNYNITDTCSSIFNKHMFHDDRSLIHTTGSTL